MLSNVSTEVIIEAKGAACSAPLAVSLTPRCSCNCSHTAGRMSRWLAVDAHFQSDVSSLSLPSLNLGPGTELRLSLRGDVTMEKADRGYEKLERQEGSDFRALPTSNKTENQKSIQTAWKKNSHKMCFLWAHKADITQYISRRHFFPHSIPSEQSTKCVVVWVWMIPLLVTRCVSAAAAAEAGTLTLHLSHKHYK